MKLISVFERAGHKDYADNVRQMLVADGIPSDATDDTPAHSPKPFPEPKPEFPSIESKSLSSCAATTTTTVVVEKEDRQGIEIECFFVFHRVMVASWIDYIICAEQEEEIVHLKAEELKILEHATENIDSEPDVEPEVMLTKL